MPANLYDLHRAALDGDDDAVTHALKTGADINALDDQGRTPIMCAVAGDRYAVDALRDHDRVLTTPNRSYQVAGDRRVGRVLHDIQTSECYTHYATSIPNIPLLLERPPYRHKRCYPLKYGCVAEFSQPCASTSRRERGCCRCRWPGCSWSYSPHV